MKEIYWVLPVLFIFHDFEEIIFMEGWMKRLDKDKLYTRFLTRLVNKTLKHFNTISTEKFAISVYILYIILIVCTLLSCIWNLELFWTSMFLVFTFHLFIHCLQAVLIGGYIPAVLTSILCIPICLWILRFVFTDFNYPLYALLWMTLAVSIIAILILCGLHWIMGTI